MHVLALACENIFWTFPSDQNSLHLLLWLPLCAAVSDIKVFETVTVLNRPGKAGCCHCSIVVTCTRRLPLKKYTYLCAHIYIHTYMHIYLFSVALVCLTTIHILRYTSSFIITYVLPRLICEGLLNLKLKHLIKTYCAFQACLHGAKLEVELQSSSLLSTAVRKNGASLQMTEI